MRIEQLHLFSASEPPSIPGDVISALKECIVDIGKKASDMTLRMTYLDPDNTRSQTIGTYLRDNLTSRLENDLRGNVSPGLRVIVVGRQFKLCIDSKNGMYYSFPVHRCGVDYIPKGGAKLKKDVRTKEFQVDLVGKQPSGLFVGVTYHEENGLIEMFLGQLVPLGYKKKLRTNILAMLYCKSRDAVNVQKFSDHYIEEVASPIVGFRQN